MLVEFQKSSGPKKVHLRPQGSQKAWLCQFPSSGVRLNKEKLIEAYEYNDHIF